MGKAKSFVPDSTPKKFHADAVDDGPDVSGLNDAPPAIPEDGPQSIPATAMHSGLQGVSFGLADEAQGLIGAGVEGAGAALEKLGLKDAPEYLGDPLEPNDAPPSVYERVLKAYKQTRDAERGDVHKGEQDNPKTAIGAELVGAALAPGPKVKSAKGLARVGEFAKAGAKTGAAFGFGKSEADNPVGVAGDTALGGASGGASGAAIGGVSAALQPLLKKMADRRAYKALDPYMKSLDPLMKKSPIDNPMQEADRLGRKALDNDLIGFGSTSAGIAKKSARALDETGEALGATLGRIQDETANTIRSPMHAKGKPLELAELVWALEDKADDAISRGDQDLASALRAESAKLAKTANDWSVAGKGTGMDLNEAENLKRMLQSKVDFKKVRNLTPDTVEAKQTAASVARKAVEDAAEAVAGPEEVDAFRALKGRFGDLSEIADTAGYGSGRLARNNWLSLGDQQAAQVGAHGGDIRALLMALGNKLARERGSSSAARGADYLQKGGGVLPALKAEQSITTDEDTKRKLARYLGLME